MRHFLMFKFTEFLRIINSADDPLQATVHSYASTAFYAFSALIRWNIKQMVRIDSLAPYWLETLHLVSYLSSPLLHRARELELSDEFGHDLKI
jgi:hypothetical protein